ncbi:MAG: aminotransferase class V-fold PLP-dependent enzyme [Candidatus Micrarchaeota archaeon]
MLLFTPGPVSVPKEILEAQTQEMITHRGKEYQVFYKSILDKLKPLLNAEQVHILTGSGTLGIESNVQNALQEGAKALVLSNGAFADRLAEHAILYYPGSTTIRLNDAKGWSLERAKPHIDKASAEGAKLLCMVHHETSPGILNKIQEICKYAKSKGMLTLVDGTSAFPAYPIDHQKDSVDFYSWATQKAIACPPGLCIVSHSKDAIAAIQNSPVRSNYMNLKEFIKSQEKYENPNTPAISLMYALQKALDLLENNGGLPAFIAHHQKLSEIARDEIEKMGFKLVVEPEFKSSSVICFFTQKNKELNSLLQSKYGVKLGGGHADWKGNSLRFCVMGDLNEEKVREGLSALKKAKEELGV